MNKYIYFVVGLAIVGVASYLIWDTNKIKENSQGNEIPAVVANDVTNAQSVSIASIGKWQSLDDSKFVEEFTPGGVITIYDGKVLSNDTYGFFNSGDLPQRAVPNPVPNSVYLNVISTSTGALWFRITKINEVSLEMIYEGRGNILRFEKIIK